MYKDLCLPDKQPWQEQSPHPGRPLQLSVKTLRKCIYPFFFCLSQSLLCCSRGFTICSEAPAVSATLYLWDTDTEYPQRYSGYPGLFAGISFLFPTPPHTVKQMSSSASLPPPQIPVTSVTQGRLWLLCSQHPLPWPSFLDSSSSSAMI